MTDPYYDAVSALLADADNTVTADRGETHGHLTDNFEQIASFWSAYLGQEIDPVDVAMMMVLTKISRQRVGSRDMDHYEDILGYGSIAGAFVEVGERKEGELRDEIFELFSGLDGDEKPERS